MTWLWSRWGGIGAVLRDLASRRRGATAGTDVVNRLGAVLFGVVAAAVEEPTWGRLPRETAMGLRLARGGGVATDGLVS